MRVRSVRVPPSLCWHFGDVSLISAVKVGSRFDQEHAGTHSYLCLCRFRQLLSNKIGKQSLKRVGKLDEGASCTRMGLGGGTFMSPNRLSVLYNFVQQLKFTQTCLMTLQSTWPSPSLHSSKSWAKPAWSHFTHCVGVEPRILLWSLLNLPLGPPVLLTVVTMVTEGNKPEGVKAKLSCTGHASRPSPTLLICCLLGVKFFSQTIFLP